MSESADFGISVIVPTYNRERYIAACLDSILSQEYSGCLEIIVCDDGSTDRTLEIARSFGPPTVVLEKPGHCIEQGPAAARNRGITASKQPLIALLDSDDLFLPGHLQRLSLALKRHPEVMMVFDDACFFFREKRSPIDYPDCLKTISDAVPFLLEPLPPTNAILFRRKILDAIGPAFDPELLFAEDNDFRLRVAERFPVSYVPGLGSAVREHDERSIRTSLSEERFHYDMKMLEKARKRHPHPGWAIRFRKAKLYYHAARGEKERKRYFRALRLFFRAVATSPKLVLGTCRDFLSRLLRKRNAP